MHQKWSFWPSPLESTHTKQLHPQRCVDGPNFSHMFGLGVGNRYNFLVLWENIRKTGVIITFTIIIALKIKIPPTISKHAYLY